MKHKVINYSVSCKTRNSIRNFLIWGDLEFPDAIFIIQVHLESYNAKHAQFKILPRYKVKSEGEFVSRLILT